MIGINLLPHREEKRRARRQQFYSLSGLVGALAALIVLLGYSVISGYIGTQESKNAFLQQEIAVLDKQIEQISRLKGQTQALLARKQIIESLQRDRAEAVHLLSELAVQTPDGVYLRSVKQEEARIGLTGLAQSNARVSALMRNMEASPWLERPQLLEISATTVDRRRLSAFNMNVSLKRTPIPAVAPAGAKERP